MMKIVFLLFSTVFFYACDSLPVHLKESSQAYEKTIEDLRKHIALLKLRIKTLEAGTTAPPVFLQVGDETVQRYDAVGSDNSFSDP